MNEKIIIIGAGPAGLMAAEKLALKGYKVDIYEHNKAAGRKFLVAGHGGFNLTHSEDTDTFISRYAQDKMASFIKNFDNSSTVKWLNELDIETYVGSSGKIFPIEGIKPIQVLNNWLKKLNKLGVSIHYEHKFIDFEKNTVKIDSKKGPLNIRFTRLILALGGGSWKKTGSTAEWIKILENKNIKIQELESANSGYNTSFNLESLEGQNLKNIEVKFENISKKGEIVFTKYGIEGSPLYFLNRFTRPHPFPLKLYIDLKPSTTKEEIETEINKSKNITKTLKDKIKLNSTGISLLKTLNKEQYTSPSILSEKIKNFEIKVTSLRPIDEVISTAGGVCFSELNEDLSLIKYSNVYCIGEMLDWEAPTGGYLLQACFSTGDWVAKHIKN